MRYRLRAGLHYCVAGGRVIFLDVQRDTYFALSHPADAAFQRLCAGVDLADEEHHALQPLLLKGLIGQGGAGSALPSAPKLCRPDDLPIIESAARLNLRTFVCAISAQIASALALRCRSFSAIIATLERRQSNRKAGLTETSAGSLEHEGRTLAAISAAFAATNMVFRPADRCLARSLAFVSVCRSRGLYPSLVFGVRTNPFVAHCWVQAGERIVHDDSGEAPLYTPILVV